MQSSEWGRNLWPSMFHIAAGYDLNETPKHIKDQQYSTFFKSLGATIPCRYCRDSYVKFYAALDINRYMQMPSCGLIRFVYDLKNLVNHKLETQEQKALEEEFRNLAKTTRLDDPKFWEEFRKKAQKICYTKPAPPFQQVVEDIMKFKASCSAKMKTCRDPLTPKFPTAPTQTFEDPNVSGKLDREMYSGGAKQKKKSVKRKPVSRRRATSRVRSRRR